MNAPNNTATSSETDKPALDEETFPTNRSAAVLPWGCGEIPVVPRWCSPIYGQTNKKKKSSSGGKGGKGGGGETTIYYGKICGWLSCGRSNTLEKILENGQMSWAGPIDISTASNPTTINLKGGGVLTFYFGTGTQAANAVANSFEAHPPYKNICWFIFDGPFGDKGETQPPVLKFFMRRSPEQSIVTGGPVASDGHYTANAIAVGAEVLTSWLWAGRSSSDLDVTSFQAVADELCAETVTMTGRQQTSIAPFVKDATEIYALLQKIAQISGCFFRWNKAGKIEACRWKRNAASTVSYTTFGFYDFTEEPELDGDTLDEIPTGYSFEFRNAEAYHKTDAVDLDNLAARMMPGASLLRQTVNYRDMLIEEEMTRRIGNELIKSTTIPALKGVFKVRREKCVNPDSSLIRPGDYFAAPVTLDPQASVIQVTLFRCVKRSYSHKGPITLYGERDIDADVHPTTVSSPEPLVTSIAQPPVGTFRLVSLPPIGDGHAAIAPLIDRPHDMSVECDVSYCKTVSGDYQSLGTTGFALPMRLNASFGSGATTIRLQVLPNEASGARHDRELHYITDWAGGTTDGADNQLLIVLVKKVGGAIDQVTAGGRDFMEVLSVNGTATLVSSGVYDVPVLRGRWNTNALAWTSGSFPDAFSNYEAWVVPSSFLLRATHSDFDAAIGSGSTKYFRFTPNSIHGPYDPNDAYVERQRLATISAPLVEYSTQPDATTFMPAASFIPAATVLDAPASVTLTAPVLADGMVPAYDSTTQLKPGVWLTPPTVPTSAGELVIEYGTGAFGSPPSNFGLLGTLGYIASPRQPRIAVQIPTALILTTYVYVRVGIQASGLRSNWTRSAFPPWRENYAGNIGQQDEDATRLSGLSTGSTGASSVMELAAKVLYRDATTLAAGATYFDINISNRGFLTKPDTVSGSPTAINDDQMMWRYDWDDAAQTSTNVRIKVFRRDGAAISAGTWRWSLDIQEYN